MVIVATLWPDFYAAYTTVPAPGGADTRARKREVLDLATVIRIDPAFSPGEQARARAAAARDRRLAIALESAGYGLTQTLAAAPQLVARWQDAQAADPYAWAVLTAALDAARLGARAPLSADLLTAARWVIAPARLLYHYAIPLYRHATDVGDEYAAWRLDDLLAERGDVDGLRARADVGDEYAAERLAKLLARRGDLDALRARADAGDGRATWQLAKVLAERGDVDEALDVLRVRADAGDEHAAGPLARLLIKQGRREEAERLRQFGLNPDGSIACA